MQLKKKTKGMFMSTSELSASLEQQTTETEGTKEEKRGITGRNKRTWTTKKKGNDDNTTKDQKTLRENQRLIETK